MNTLFVIVSMFFSEITFVTIFYYMEVFRKTFICFRTLFPDKECGDNVTLDCFEDG